MKQSILLSSAYLAPIQYYTKLISENFDILIDPYEHYIKQSYRNRCCILTANGVQTLSIPVESANGFKIAMKDVRIAEHGNWQHLHWNALISAYNSTPFFEYYKDDFYPFYHKKYSFLFDFNEELRALICDKIDIDSFLTNYTTEYCNSEDYKDLRTKISPKIKEGEFIDNNFNKIPYYQAFPDRFDFIENLSIVDLLFNMGSESLLILNNSIKKPLK